jgi:L-fucose isomerase-like protein
MTVTGFELPDLFDRARAAPESAASGLRTTLSANLAGLDGVDQTELERSLRLKLALDGMKAEGGFDAFAIRCWPETFTEYGGAVCGPASMMGEGRVPCACEADVYGAATQLLLQAASDQPVFLVDLVDLDPSDDTGVVWHCGQAPISMADPDVVARATIHTNRKMPLLFEFPLKPGPVTFVRLSQARGQQSLIIARGEMLKRDMAFTGTSGVVTVRAPGEGQCSRASSTAGWSITWRWPMAIMSGRWKASPLPPACRWFISRIFPNIRALPWQTSDTASSAQA